VRPTNSQIETHIPPGHEPGEEVKSPPESALRRDKASAPRADGFDDVRVTKHPGEPALDALEIFGGVAPELLDPAERCEYRHGEVIIASGDVPQRLHVLVRGNAQIREGGVHIASRSAVRLLGELALIDGLPRSASVIAEGAAVTYEFTHEHAARLMEDSNFLRNLAKELVWKLRNATSDRAWRYRNEELLFGEFRAHASPELLQELLRAGELGTPRRAEVVTLFTDIRGFTTKTMKVAPERLTRDLAAFFDVAVTVIHAHGGMIDKFIGDAVMAIWGYAPNPNDPERAVAAAAELVQRAATLTIDGEALRIGVGMESGLVTLGVVGAPGKRQFTALGPSVNLAARLQDETKAIGAPICLGPDLAQRLPPKWREQLGDSIERDIRGIGAVRVWPLTPKE